MILVLMISLLMSCAEVKSYFCVLCYFRMATSHCSYAAVGDPTFIKVEPIPCLKARFIFGP
jgi:hypothetical protein